MKKTNRIDNCSAAKADEGLDLEIAQLEVCRQTEVTLSVDLQIEVGWIDIKVKLEERCSCFIFNKV